MTGTQFIDEVSAAQRKLNDLLMAAYQYQIKYQLSVNSACCIKDDDRQVVGIKMFDNTPVYNSDGVP